MRRIIGQGGRRTTSRERPIDVGVVADQLSDPSGHVSTPEPESQSRVDDPLVTKFA